MIRYNEYKKLLMGDILSDARLSLIVNNINKALYPRFIEYGVVPIPKSENYFLGVPYNIRDVHNLNLIFYGTYSHIIICDTQDQIDNINLWHKNDIKRIVRTEGLCDDDWFLEVTLSGGPVWDAGIRAIPRDAWSCGRYTYFSDAQCKFLRKILPHLHKPKSNHILIDWSAGSNEQCG